MFYRVRISDEIPVCLMEVTVPLDDSDPEYCFMPDGKRIKLNQAFDYFGDFVQKISKGKIFIKGEHDEKRRISKR